MDLATSKNIEQSERKNGNTEILMSDSSEKPVVTSYKPRIELAVFLLYSAMSLSATIFQDQVLFQSCTAVFEYNDTFCTDLGTDKSENDSHSKDIENIVQPYVSKIFMTESLVQGLVPAFLALFIGAWSDKYGRKPVILSSCIGYLCFFVIKSIIVGVSLTTNVNPWIYIIASIPVSLSGGSCLLLSAVYCYVADKTHFYERPYYMCLLGGIVALGNVLGQLTSSYLYAATNATVVFAVSAGAVLLALLFIIFCIDESVKKDQLVQSSKFQGLFDWQLLKDMLRTVFQKRENFDRAIIWCIILPLIAITFDQTGKANLLFLFVRAQFNWTVKTFTIFSAVQISINFIGAVAGIIILQRILGFKMTTMTLIAFTAAVTNAAFFAAATFPWHLYLGVGLSFLLGVDAPMCQAMLANIVPLSDIGKVFALMTAFQAIAPLASAPLYTFVYNSTLATYPGAFSLIGVSLFVLCLLLIGFVHIVEMYYPNVNRAKENR